MRHWSVPAAGPYERCSDCVPCCLPPSRRSCCKRRKKTQGLLVERLGFLKDGSAVEFTQVLLPWRHLRFRRRAQYLIVNAPRTQLRCIARPSRRRKSSASSSRPTPSASSDSVSDCAQLAPRAVVTCARGSSDHAATFAKYLIETTARCSDLLRRTFRDLGLRGHAEPRRHAVSGDFAVRREPRSPGDRARRQECGGDGRCTRERGGLSSRAGGGLDVPLYAGSERSVAATKSYIGSLSAIIQLVACWGQDTQLLQALAGAPPLLERAWQQDWTAAVARLRFASDLYVIGRGLGLGITQEAALKFKETCGLHAEAVSSAEVRHGPMALIRAGFPVLMFAQNDETRGGVESLATELATRRADVMFGRR